MPYLSRILNIKIEDAADHIVGSVVDLLIKPKAGEYTSISLLLVKGKDRKEFCLPLSQVAVLSGKEVSLKVLENKIERLPVPENEYTYLKRDVLDQQIVDVGGARVVRVNDLRLTPVNGMMSVIGICVGFKSLLRRLGLDRFDFLDFLKENLIDWRKTQLVKDQLRLDALSNDIKTLHPADLANIIEDLTVKQGGQLVHSLDEKSAAQVLEELEPELQKILVNNLGPEKSAAILKKMSVDEIVDLMQTMNKKEVSEVLSRLENKQAEAVRRLIRYEHDTAGGLMSTDYVKVFPKQTITEIIEFLEKISPAMRSILYVYVVDEDNKLLGAVSMRTLLIEDESKKIGEIYKPLSVVSVLKPENKLDEITELMTKYNLFTAAVTDEDGKILGVVTIDDVMRELKPNA